MKVTMECLDLMAYNKLLTTTLEEIRGKKIKPISNLEKMHFETNETLYYAIDNIVTNASNVHNNLLLTTLYNKQQYSGDVEYYHSHVRITNRAIYLLDHKYRQKHKIELDQINNIEIKEENLIINSAKNKIILLKTNNMEMNFKIVITIDAIYRTFNTT